MRRAELKHLVSTTAQARLEALRTQPYAQLAQLPSHSTENLAGTKAVVATYRDDIGEGRVRIVVQGFLPGWLGSAYVCPYGFTVGPDGSVARLNEEALWDFT
jgi:hypothetical protein